MNKSFSSVKLKVAEIRRFGDVLNFDLLFLLFLCLFVVFVLCIFPNKINKFLKLICT